VAGVIVRPVTPEDDPAIREISAAYDNLGSWPERPDFLDHEAATGRMYVAEDHEGAAVGFGGSFDRGDVVYLADLFIRPDVVGRGIGRALLERILDRGTVHMTSASSDPRALPLYARFGMRPLMPALYLRAPASRASVALAADPDSRQAAAATIAEIDAEISGRARLPDHEFLQAARGAEGRVLQDGPRLAAYGWTRVVTVRGNAGPEARAYIAPAGARTPEAMDRMTRDLVVRAAQAVSDAATAAKCRVADVSLLVLGPHPTLPALLAGGFRIVDRDTFMCSRVDLIDGRRYAHSPELG